MDEYSPAPSTNCPVPLLDQTKALAKDLARIRDFGLPMQLSLAAAYANPISPILFWGNMDQLFIFHSLFPSYCCPFNSLGDASYKCNAYAESPGRGMKWRCDLTSYMISRTDLAS